MCKFNLMECTARHKTLQLQGVAGDAQTMCDASIRRVALHFIGNAQATTTTFLLHGPNVPATGEPDLGQSIWIAAGNPQLWLYGEEAKRAWRATTSLNGERLTVIEYFPPEEEKKQEAE